jgi:hypothetical protein
MFRLCKQVSNHYFSQYSYAIYLFSFSLSLSCDKTSACVTLSEFRINQRGFGVTKLVYGLPVLRHQLGCHPLKGKQSISAPKAHNFKKIAKLLTLTPLWPLVQKCLRGLPTRGPSSFVLKLHYLFFPLKRLS